MDEFKSEGKPLMELFTIHTPNVLSIPLIANIPHSGIFIPKDIAAQFTPQHLSSLPNTDWHLDKLYDFLQSLGITVLLANYSRYVVDLNRQIQLPISGNFWTSVIPLSTAFPQSIYTQKPTKEEIQQRIQDFYIPYHTKLKTLLCEQVSKFGKVYLLDLHSFFGPITDQICLGNVNGKSCSEFLISSVEQSFVNLGLQVVKNKTFTGGYITRQYSQIPGVEVLQIEVRYHVYLDENQLEQPHPPDCHVPHFYQARSKFKDIFAEIVNTMFSIIKA